LVKHKLPIKGFTLIELAIVMVIISLIIGAIIGAQSLIRSARANRIVTEVVEYKKAVLAFKLEYNSFPGDMPDATDYWGSANGTDTIWWSCSASLPASGTQTCDGDGDGQVTGEQFLFWQHLANAEMIGGTYTGVTGSESTGHHVPGINTPETLLDPNAGFSVYYQGVISGLTYMFDGTYGHVIEFGRCEDWDCIEYILTPKEMRKIDRKIDDGYPGKGLILTRPDGASGHIYCVEGDNTEAATATYELSYTDEACAFYYRNAF
jgi:prepilin-type N-terminal cleavage/methylation domain-containing protein